MIFKNKTFDILKWICLIALPATATLYGTAAAIWSLPYAQEIPQTIMAVDTFLGVLLGISNAQYYKMQGQDSFEEGKDEEALRDSSDY